MITIVIASYKYGHLAAQAIESVLSQTRKADQILFVDDAAGDCGHLPALYPQVDFIFRKQNFGTANNFQDMLHRVETDKCMFLGADNWLRSDALAILDRMATDIVTYDIIVTGEYKGEILDRHPHEVKAIQGDVYWDRSAGHHGSMLYRTALAKEVGYFSPPGRSLEDLNLYQGMIERGASRIHVPAALLFYRRHIHNFNPVK